MSEEVDRQVLKRYDIHQKLGKGAYGVVWRAVDKKSNEVVAVKKIFDAFQNSTDSQRTYREVVFLHELAHHDSVITLLNVMRPSPTNCRDLYLVFENMDTDLHTAIRSKILTPVHRRYIIYQLLKTLKYLHNCKILHRDMKPSNILINSDCKIKVADFGLARLIKTSSGTTNRHFGGGTGGTAAPAAGAAAAAGGGGGGAGAGGGGNAKAGMQGKHGGASNFALTDYVATRWYRAPEILLGSHAYGFPVDMWSVGCILGEMLAHKPMFPGTSTMNQIQRIIDVTGRPDKEEVGDMKSDYAESMLESFMHARMDRNGGGIHGDFGSKKAAVPAKRRESFMGGGGGGGGAAGDDAGVVAKLMKKVSMRTASSKLRPQLSKSDDDTFGPVGEAADAVCAALSRLYPRASGDELDLMSRLLRFSPNDRLTAKECLEHSYVALFVSPSAASADGADDDEDKCDHEIVMPFDDDVRFSTSQYREKLYTEIETRSKEARRRAKERQQQQLLQQQQHVDICT